MSDFMSRAAQALPILRENAVQVDASATFPHDGVKALRQTGLFSMTVPVEYGGLGGEVDDLVEVAGVLARGCASTTMVWAMHCQQVDAVARHGSSRLRAEVLPRVVGEGYYLGSATTEPSKGGHLLTADSAMEGTGENLRVKRDAPIVTGGEVADGFLVTMRSHADASPNQVSLVHLDRAQTVVEVTGDWDAMGMRGTRSVPMRLDGVAAPHQIIGEPGQFRTVAVESMIPLGHLTWAACWLGAAHGALDGVVNVMRSSSRSGGPSRDSPVVLHRLANVRVRLELISSLLWHATEGVVRRRAGGLSLDDRDLQVQLDSLKIASADLSFSAVDELVQLAGVGIGYRRGAPVPLERVFRDLRSASLNNSNDRLRQSVGAYTLLTGAGRGRREHP